MIHDAQSSVTISGDLIAHVRALHKMAADKIDRGDTDLSPLAIPAYIVAVASVEAFVNDVFLSKFASMILGEGLLPAESDKLDLALKLILLPHLAFGRTLSKDMQPYQDMALLIRLRNELVHYKMGAKPPKTVKELAQRGIAIPIPPKQEESGGPHPWAYRVSTLDGIRWANNTACATVCALVGLFPSGKQPPVAALAANFQPIP